MAWNSLSFSVGEILTSSKMNQLQANFAALAAGDSGAPDITVASRHVMTTAGIENNPGYWIKIATLDPDTTNYADITLRLIFGHGDVTYKAGTTEIEVALGQDTINLSATLSSIKVLSVTNESNPPSLNFAAVSASTLKGAPIELWVQWNETYGVLNVVEVANMTGLGAWTVNYHPESTWTATDPTSGAAFAVTSDWAQLDGGQLPTPTVTGFTPGYLSYIDDAGDSQSGNWFDAGSVISTTWESIGPTGSGATNIWTALDAVPTGAKAIIIRVSGYKTSAAEAYAYARKTGTTSSPSPYYNMVAVCVSDGATANKSIAEFIIPVDASNRFDMYIVAMTFCGVSLAGFIM